MPESKVKSCRYVYKTKGVCPPEIHFRIDGEILRQVRFVGGGCPGNARLVGHLLEGRNLSETTEILEGITCRNGTSCPDQLASAIRSALEGRLQPSFSFRVQEANPPGNRVGLIGDLGGSARVLENLLPRIAEQEVTTVFCLGNLTGRTSENEPLLRLVRERGLTAVQGEADWAYAQDKEGEGFPSITRKERDFLLRLPQVISFDLGGKKVMAFYGDYLQRLPGFSDYEPFALEMNMVCDLTRFLEDTTVFPALETMVPQFQARVVIFSQPGWWGHRRIGGADFIGVGPAAGADGFSWAILEAGGELSFRIMRIR